MNNTIFEIFNIDNTYYKTIARVLFVFLILLNLSIVLLNIGDNNFDDYFDWIESVSKSIENGNTDQLKVLIDNIPLTHGNIVYIACNVVIELITFVGSMFYCGIHIKGYRKENSIECLTWSKLFMRFAIFCLGVFVFFIPGSILVLSLIAFFIIIFPYIILYPACYLSGDYGYFKSFEQMIVKTKGYFFLNMKNVFVIMLASTLFGWGCQLIAIASPIAAVVTNSFLNVLITLSFGRYIAMTYIRITNPVQVEAQVG